MNFQIDTNMWNKQSFSTQASSDPLTWTLLPFYLQELFWIIKGRLNYVQYNLILMIIGWLVDWINNKGIPITSYKLW